jgi:hypothetical protein
MYALLQNASQLFLPFKKQDFPGTTLVSIYGSSESGRAASYDCYVNFRYHIENQKYAI